MSISKSVETLFISNMERKIISGSWQTGEKLPSERELVKMFGCSRQTVHNGLIKLSNLGLVTIIPRQGVIVNDYMNTGDFNLLEVMIHLDREELSDKLKLNMIDFMMLQMSLIFQIASNHPYDEQLDLLIEDMSRISEHYRPQSQNKPQSQNYIQNQIHHDMSTSKEDIQILSDFFFKYFYTVCQSTDNSMFLLLINSFEIGIKNAAAYLFQTPTLIEDTIQLLLIFNKTLKSDSPDFTTCLTNLSDALKKYWLKGGPNEF